MDQTKPVSHIVAGILIAAVVVLVSLTMALTSGSSPQGGWISYLFIILGLVIFIQRYARANDYTLSFGELFSYGFKTSTIVTLIFVVFLIILSLAYPQMKQNVIDATRLEMEKQKGFKDSDIETVIQGIDKYFWILVIGSSMFFFVLVGALGSLLGAAITKKRPSQP